MPSEGPTRGVGGVLPGSLCWVGRPRLWSRAGFSVEELGAGLWGQRWAEGASLLGPECDGGEPDRLELWKVTPPSWGVPFGSPREQGGACPLSSAPPPPGRARCHPPVSEGSAEDSGSWRRDGVRPLSAGPASSHRCHQRAQLPSRSPVPTPSPVWAVGSGQQRAALHLGGCPSLIPMPAQLWAVSRQEPSDPALVLVWGAQGMAHPRVGQRGLDWRWALGSLPHGRP